ncbi:MAG: hypothetical protein OJF49_002634 [Ktedonobacterales bacterium]|jgi:MFS family permease|nr:MAG: hypothetical protein OJF49_002634 [Ktedonobacterales bacterium]
MSLRHVGDEASFEHDGEGAALLGVRQQLSLSVLWFALNFQSAALLPIVLPVQIALFIAPAGQAGNAQQAAFLGWIGAIGAVITLVATPISGAFSDRTTSGFGRRRPYILLGGVLLLGGASVLADPQDAGYLIAGISIFSVGSGICTGGYQGLLPDLVPAVQRGAASGYLGVMTILGNVGSLALAGLLLGVVSAGTAEATWHGAAIFYLLTGIVLLLGVGITLASVRETPLSAAPPLADTFRQRFSAAWLEPFRHRDFTWVFLTRSFVMLGLNLFLTFIAYYFASVAHIQNFAAATAAVAVLALLGATASAFALGQMSDRIGRVGLVCFSSACMSLAALAFVVLPAGFPLWPLGVVFGLGYGAYASVDWALAVDSLPSPAAFGKDMGIWSIASNLPAILAPLLGGIVITVAGALGYTAQGYRAIFALAVVFLVAGAICILLVRDAVTARKGGQPRERRVGFGWRLAFRTRAGQARGFLRFWPVWERLNRWVHPVHPIPNAPYGLFLVQFTRYRRRPITLPDGTRVGRGDAIAVLHINNRLIAQGAGSANSFRLLGMIAGDLRALAVWSATPGFPPEVRALFGYTLLNRAAPRLGFTLRERGASLYNWLDGFFMMGLLALYNPEGTRRLRHGTTYGSRPVEVWMSRGELARRYGSRGGQGHGAV